MKRKYAIITGAARRLGREIALRLAKNGYDILLIYNKSDITQTYADIRKYGVNCKALKFDLSEYEKIPDFMESLNKQGFFDGIGLLVNNASVFLRCLPEDTTPQILDNTFRVNFFAPYQLTRTFVQYAEKGSSVINIADSKASKNGTAYSAYVLSKKILIDMTLQFAAAFAPKIRINVICPGSLMASDNESQECFERRAEKAPMKSAGSVEEVLAMAEFLHERTEVTGQILYADGGMHTLTGEL